MFKLVRLFGVDVYLHWSLILLVALLYPDLSQFVDTRTHVNTFTNIVITLVLCVSFIGSILFHELAHSLVGQRFGIEMNRITLFVFGGAASMSSKLREPSHEFWMALAGPASSVVLGLAFFLVALLTRDNVAVATPCIMLASVNVALGIFNLIPAFPTDGGRVVRAIAWWKTGSYLKATEFAGFGGKVFGCIFMACGVSMIAGFDIPLFGTGTFNGIWTGFIGWMIYNMADREVMAARG